MGTHIREGRGRGRHHWVVREGLSEEEASSETPLGDFTVYHPAFPQDPGSLSLLVSLVTPKS